MKVIFIISVFCSRLWNSSAKENKKTLHWGLSTFNYLIFTFQNPGSASWYTFIIMIYQKGGPRDGKRYFMEDCIESYNSEVYGRKNNMILLLYAT